MKNYYEIKSTDGISVISSITGVGYEIMQDEKCENFYAIPKTPENKVVYEKYRDSVRKDLEGKLIVDFVKYLKWRRHYVKISKEAKRKGA